MADVGLLFGASLPYLVMTVAQLCQAFFISLLQFVIADGVNATVLVVYEQILAAAFLSCLALFFERGKRPPLTLSILSWAFFIGLLKIPIGELMLTVSLRYITATFQSVALNTLPAVVFVLAVLTGRESFRFRSLNGQAKLLGIVASCAGGAVLVLVSDPGVSHSGSATEGGRVIGSALVGLAVLAMATSNLLVEKLALKYCADLTLSATMGVFGTLQTLLLVALMERNPSSWKIRWSKSLQLLSILYGGIVTTGLGYFAQNWCVSKKGPVTASAFSPLLVVFSFLLQTIVFGASVQLWSIAATLLVIGGLYLLLWAKSRDYAKDDQKPSSHYPRAEPLLVNST